MTLSPDEIIVIKLDAQENEVWRYPGRVLETTDQSILIEARFNHGDVNLHGITLRKNDRFLERYYANRWYNLFEVRDLDDDHLKGWYCNVTRPAQFTDGKIVYIDLALDLLAYPDGQFLVLDEDEFEALDLDSETQKQALAGLEALIAIARNKSFAEEIQH